jgi:hypothetical protein
MTLIQHAHKLVDDSNVAKGIISNIPNGVGLIAMSSGQLKGWAEAIVPLTIIVLNLAIASYWIAKLVRLKSTGGDK